MKQVVSPLVALAGVLAFSTLCSAEANSVVALFDGTTLQGWEGDSHYWRVENGAVVGEIPPGQTLAKNTWLVWRGGEVADFDLHLQFRLTGAAAANSGIQFRCQAEDVDHVAGYQADLDMGATWLGRIYDEDGRALLVERGARVAIEPDGRRRAETFAPARQYAVLFRENGWNDYRIVAVGEHVAVYVNGTLFSELQDRQTGERDLKGGLALQLHAGPETRIEFRNVMLERLAADDKRIGTFSLKPQVRESVETVGIAPKSAEGADLNLSLETGALAPWKATGDAFKGQPVNRDGISDRWPGQASNKSGEFFIGGYELVRDAGVGALTSPPFPVTHPYASFLIAGGDTQATRVEIIRPARGDAKEMVVFTAIGEQKEQMRRVVADLQKLRGEQIAVRLVDESRGGWGHLNFDDFRFHDQPPAPVETTAAWRTIQNPVLQHLVPNPAPKAKNETAAGKTTAQMFVEPGFSVDVVAAEPDLHQPMAFAFDAKGRLWVVEGHCYPQKRPAGEGLDRILIFADDDGDGTFENRKVFMEGLNLVSGMEVGHGGVWVGAAPELLFIPDRDGDDRPDGEPEVLLDGFGYADTHETLNSFLWGPDGWLYGNQGVFNRSLIGKPGAADGERTPLQAGVWRYHPTRRVFEVFAHGGSNPWGLDYDEHGQLFMTHCRSYWGQGLTTHVMQGGHYWNQVNAGYAPFISPTAIPGRPAMKNFLLASARYDHGEGGAGKPGSNEVYGGHSHVGTMIYLGDNWPGEFRNHLFTHNLHGHQLNHQVNVREAGGYNTMHAGRDVLFCADPQYIGVDLQCGPDGAVYISDWYDPRHCHNPDVEQWDRGNGRMYRMKFDATYRPVKVDYTAATDEALAEAQLHPNDWHVRMSRLVLSERAATRGVSKTAVRRLRELALTHPQPERRLRAVWTLHAVGAFDVVFASRLLKDESEYVRGWTVQLAVESLDESDVSHLLSSLAETESSLFVRRYLASAVPRVSRELGWRLAETLSSQPENAEDRDLPLLLWHGMAQLVPHDLPRAMKLAEETRLPALRDYVSWYATKLSLEGRDLIASRLAQAAPDELLRLLSLFELGVRGMRGLPEPSGWSEVSARLYDSQDAAIRRAAESLGAAFGDEALYDRMRQVLADDVSNTAAQKDALLILASDASPKNLPLYLQLLDSTSLAPKVIPLLQAYNDPSVADVLIARLPAWKGEENSAAMEVLSSRPAWAAKLLDAITSGKLENSLLTAYYARQMASLGDEQLSARLAREWGAFGQTPSEVRHAIAKTVAEYESAPLWAYNAQAGAEHFKKLCATCHQPDQQKQNLAPNLAGSGAKGIRYLVENILDPNAVIGRDYQARILVTADGRALSGLIESETDSAVTLRTATSRVVVAKDEIDDIRISPNSFMPVGLLQTLNDREQIELFKFLMSQ